MSTMPLETRRSLVGRYVDVNTGDLVDVGGTAHPFAQIIDPTTGHGYEHSWESIERLVRRGTLRPYDHDQQEG